MAQRRRTILLVEDSSDEASLVQRGLSRTVPDFDIVTAPTTSQAEAYLFERTPVEDSAEPELVFLDVRVPPAGGLYLLDRVRHNERTRHIPVVVLSGAMRGEDVQELYRHGANSFIDKPADGEDLKTLAGNAARYWLTLNLKPRQGPL